MTSERSSKGNGIDVNITRNEAGSLLVRGKLHAFPGSKQRIRWIAPKGIHRGMSFAGSGLPYHNADQAFEGTENRGYALSYDGSFTIELPTFPSAYYTGLGSTYIPPVLLLESVKEITMNNQRPEVFKTHVFLSPESVPYRWISGAPPGPRAAPVDGEIGRAMFYSGREELPLFQNQEMLCRYKGFPSDETAYGLPGRMDLNPWEDTPSPS
jgi:hypothetical protein